MFKRLVLFLVVLLVFLVPTCTLAWDLPVPTRETMYNVPDVVPNWIEENWLGEFKLVFKDENIFIMSWEAFRPPDPGCDPDSFVLALFMGKGNEVSVLSIQYSDSIKSIVKCVLEETEDNKCPDGFGTVIFVDETFLKTGNPGYKFEKVSKVPDLRSIIEAMKIPKVTM
jgi:hypothetical protein